MTRRLSIISASSTTLDGDWEEVAASLGAEDLISDEEIPWETEDSIIKSIDKHLKKSRTTQQKIDIQSKEFASNISGVLSDPEFDKNFYETYSAKYPQLFNNWVLKSELFDEKSLWIITSKKSTKAEIRDILNTIA